MKKFAMLFAVASLITLAGCATGPFSTLPMVDVSKMENGKTLTAAEISSVVRGKQIVGNIVRTNGNQVHNVTYVFESEGLLKGEYSNETDKGSWRVDQTTTQLCNTWSRWLSGCLKVSVRNGKLHLLNPVSGGIYLQQ